MPASSPERLLERAQAAYDTGNYVSARSCIVELLASEPPQELGDEARVLLARVNADPLAKYLFGACLLFFLIVAFAYFR